MLVYEEYVVDEDIFCLMFQNALFAGVYLHLPTCHPVNVVQDRYRNLAYMAIQSENLLLTASGICFVIIRCLLTKSTLRIDCCILALWLGAIHICKRDLRQQMSKMIILQES